MSVNREIRDNLPENVVVLESPAFDNSIIGISTDGRAIYSYERMIEEYTQDENGDMTEALDWIEYNTIRALPYMGPNAPIICEGLYI